MIQNVDDQISAIAGAHLGKAGDGTAVKPYVTPDSVDSALLVGIPRYLNRTQYGIKDERLDFVGGEIWNCYEVSFLLSNGMPVSGAVKLYYSAYSPKIVESKSLKLYLNSFNMERCNTVNRVSATEEVLARIRKDLSELLCTEVTADFHSGSAQCPVVGNGFERLEDTVDFATMQFSEYKESPDILVPNDVPVIQVQSSLLRSNCRVTNQPDWGDVFIYMTGAATPTKESLLRYIISMRKENHFHEEIAECIFQRLYDKFKPEELAVACYYTRRGGIDINPVRSTSMSLANKLFGDYLSIYTIYKTLRQ